MDQAPGHMDPVVNQLISASGRHLVLTPAGTSGYCQPCDDLVNASIQKGYVDVTTDWMIDQIMERHAQNIPFDDDSTGRHRRREALTAAKCPPPVKINAVRIADADPTTTRTFSNDPSSIADDDVVDDVPSSTCFFRRSSLGKRKAR